MRTAMAKSVKIVGLFAATGFFLPLILLAYYEMSRRFMGGTGAGDFLIWVCPTTIMSMALDHATASTAVLVWLMISVSNAILYSLPGVAVAFFVSLRTRRRA